MTCASCIETMQQLQNCIRHAEGVARCASMAFESPQVEDYFCKSIGVVVDQVVCELMEIVTHIDRVLDDKPSSPRLNN